MIITFLVHSKEAEAEPHQLENEETLAHSSLVKPNSDKKTNQSTTDSATATLTSSVHTKRMTAQTAGFKAEDSKIMNDETLTARNSGSMSAEKRFQKGASGTGFNVSPDIFVSLKKGLISDFYKIGKTVGEGNNSFTIYES